MGPLVLTEDGQYRVIANWAEMTDAEREVTRRRIEKRNRQRLEKLNQQGRAGDISMLADAASDFTTFEHTYQGFTCHVRHKPAAPGYEASPPLLLIHPIGIGIDSWFWSKFMDAWEGAEIFAPDLIGCGKSSPWDPDEQGLFVPLDWARQLEALWRDRIGPERPVNVVCQGGLAPVAVMLAVRQTDLWDGPKAVRSVTLTSPPTWEEITKGCNAADVERNFRWFSTPLGGLSYQVLCLRPFVRFFSNLFLFFGGDCDDEWLERCERGATFAARWPVFAFNSGLVGATGRANELCELRVPLLVMSGEGDKRVEQRVGYGHYVEQCELRTLSQSLNVLPWERPEECAEAIGAFVSSGTTLITNGAPPASDS